MRSAFDVPASARDRTRADDAVGLQADLGLGGLDDRHQILAIGFTIDGAREQLAVVAAHLVVEIAGDKMKNLGEFGIALARLEQQLGIDDDFVLGAGVQRLELDAQRPVLGVVGMASLEPAARVGGQRQDLQRADHVERLFREIMIAGELVRIDAAAFGVMRIAQHPRRQRHLEADELALALSGVGSRKTGRRNGYRIVGRRQAMASRLAEDANGIAGALVDLVVGDPDEIRIGGIVGDQRLGDLRLGEQLVAGEARDSLAEGGADVAWSSEADWPIAASGVKSTRCSAAAL